MNLLDKIESKEAVVSVIGLGYVGLPLAVTFAESGFRVVGIDLDGAKVEAINSGDSYVQDLPSKKVARLISNGLSATTDFDALHQVDAAIICVPTPLSKTREPDLSHIIHASEEVAKRLHRGMLIVLESTTYPGTTQEVLLPCMRPASGDVLEVGKDFFLAFSPERIDPGRTDWTVRNTPKVIGGVTPTCLEAAKRLYECAIETVVPVSSPIVAEMVKLLENTFRATNVALVNELAIMCDRLGVNVWEVIDAAKTKPFGYMPFYPGPGLGGHCIPVDPHYLAWKMKTLDYNARFIQLAEEINFAMPFYWVTKVQDALNEVGKPVNRSNILVLGVTYKRDVADIRESPALDMIDELLKRGAIVAYHDPHIGSLDTETYSLTSLDDADLYRSIAEADCVVVATEHSSYDWDKVGELSSLVVDTRNALRRGGAPPAGA